MQWRPRTELAAADAESREEDWGDFALSSAYRELILNKFEVQPTVDLFAAQHNALTPRSARNLNSQKKNPKARALP